VPTAADNTADDAQAARRTAMTAQLLVSGILGIATTAVAFWVNRHLFSERAAGPVTILEGVYYVVGVCSLVLGWYFNVRYTHTYHNANYWNYTKMLFTNWAADSAAQDYIIVNVVLMPLWTIVEGTRRGLKWAWIFFVMSLFTSLAFSIALFLAFMERQLRYNRALVPSRTA
jgi:glycopeptide antibiotics resistance protein